MKNKKNQKTDLEKQQLTNEEQEQERMELLRQAAETPGRQLNSTPLTVN